MRITANLASRPFADLGPTLKRLRIGMGVLALVAVALGAGLYALHTKAAQARARDHSLDASIATVQREQETYMSMVHQPQNQQVLDQVAALNRLFDEKSFSWTLAMEDLETVLPGGVQVSTLEPIRDKKDGHIELHMRVLGPRDKAGELVENLERSRRFRAPRIIGESSETAGNGNQQQVEPVSLSNRINLDLVADYNPSTAEERRAAGRSEKGGKQAVHAPVSSAGRTRRTAPVSTRPAGRATPGAGGPR